MQIPYGRQTIDEEDIWAVTRILKSDYLTTGPMIPEFEKTIADYTGAKYAVALANGTAALHAALLRELGREMRSSRHRLPLRHRQTVSSIAAVRLFLLT